MATQSSNNSGAPSQPPGITVHSLDDIEAAGRVAAVLGSLLRVDAVLGPGKLSTVRNSDSVVDISPLELARVAGCEAMFVRRTLADFERGGLIKVDGNRITIRGEADGSAPSGGEAA